jgi:hypothetical protein
MWKVEFAYTHSQKKITLYVADDAFIYEQPLNRHIIHNNTHIQECLKKLAGQFARQHETDEDEVIFVKSLYFFKEEGTSFITLAMHAKNKTVAFKEDITQVVYKTNETNSLGTHTFSCEEIKDHATTLAIRDLFDADDTEAWGRYLLTHNRLPPVCEVAIAPADIVAENIHDGNEADLLNNYVKNNLIIALYNAARDYYLFIWQLAKTNPETLASNINLFNLQFAGVAAIGPNLSLTSIDAAYLALQDFPLFDKENGASLEAIINDLIVRCADTQNDNAAYEHIINRLNEFNQRPYLDPRTKTLMSGNFFSPLVVATDDRLIQSMHIVPGARALSTHAMSVVTLAKNKLLSSTPKKLFAFNDMQLQQTAVSRSGSAIDMNVILDEVKQINDEATRDVQELEKQSHLSAEASMVDVAENTSINRGATLNLVVEPPSENKIKRFFEKIRPSYVKKHHPVLFKALIGLAIGLVVAAIAAAVITAIVFSGGAAVAVGGAAVMFAATVSSTTTLATLGGVAGVAGMVTGIGIAAAGGGMAVGATIGAVQESKKRKRAGQIRSEDIQAISNEKEPHSPRAQRNETASPPIERKAKQSRSAEVPVKTTEAPVSAVAETIRPAPPVSCRLYQSIPGLRNMYSRENLVPSAKQFLHDVASLYLEINSIRPAANKVDRDNIIDVTLRNLFRLDMDMPQPTFKYVLKSVLKSEAYQGFSIDVFQNTDFFPVIEKAQQEIREAAKREFQNSSGRNNNIVKIFHPRPTQDSNPAIIAANFKAAALMLYRDISCPSDAKLLDDETLHALNQRKLTLPSLTYAMKAMLKDDAYKNLDIELFKETPFYRHVKNAQAKLISETLHLNPAMKM